MDRSTMNSIGPPPQSSWVHFKHFKTIPGIVKIIELVFGIVVVACATPPVLTGTYFLLITAYSALCLTFGWMIIIFFRIDTKTDVKPSWTVLELVYNGIIFVLYAISTAIQFSIFAYMSFVFYDPKPRNYSAAAFAVMNCVTYGIGCIYAFKAWRLYGGNGSQNHH